jgi:hypothetical protein
VAATKRESGTDSVAKERRRSIVTDDGSRRKVLAMPHHSNESNSRQSVNSAVAATKRDDSVTKRLTVSDSGSRAVISDIGEKSLAGNEFQVQMVDIVKIEPVITPMTDADRLKEKLRKRMLRHQADTSPTRPLKNVLSQIHVVQEEIVEETVKSPVSGGSKSFETIQREFNELISKPSDGNDTVIDAKEPMNDTNEPIINSESLEKNRSAAKMEYSKHNENQKYETEKADIPVDEQSFETIEREFNEMFISGSKSSSFKSEKSAINLKETKNEMGLDLTSKPSSKYLLQPSNHETRNPSNSSSNQISIMSNPNSQKTSSSANMDKISNDSSFQYPPSLNQFSESPTLSGHILMNAGSSVLPSPASINISKKLTPTTRGSEASATSTLASTDVDSLNGMPRKKLIIKGKAASTVLDTNYKPSTYILFNIRLGVVSEKWNYNTKEETVNDNLPANRYKLHINEFKVEKPHSIASPHLSIIAGVSSKSKSSHSEISARKESVLQESNRSISSISTRRKLSLKRKQWNTPLSSEDENELADPPAPFINKIKLKPTKKIGWFKKLKQSLFGKKEKHSTKLLKSSLEQKKKYPQSVSGSFKNNIEDRRPTSRSSPNTPFYRNGNNSMMNFFFGSQRNISGAHTIPDKELYHNRIGSSRSNPENENSSFRSQPVSGSYASLPGVSRATSSALSKKTPTLRKRTSFFEHLNSSISSLLSTFKKKEMEMEKGEEIDPKSDRKWNSRGQKFSRSDTKDSLGDSEEGEGNALENFFRNSFRLNPGDSFRSDSGDSLPSKPGKSFHTHRDQSSFGNPSFRQTRYQKANRGESSNLNPGNNPVREYQSNSSHISSHLAHSTYLSKPRDSNYR